MVREAPAQTTRLTERDLAIIDHVHRYRISTRQVLYEEFFRGLKPAAATSTLRRIAAPHNPKLTEAERRARGRSFFLTPQVLAADGTICYRLSQRGAKHISATHELPPRISEKLGRPLNIRSLEKNHAILAFCCLGGRRRQRITFREFTDRLAPLKVRGCPVEPYVFELDLTPPRLGFVRIDYANSRPQTYVNKAYHDLEKRCVNEAFRAKIDEGRFVVFLLAPTEKRAKRLSLACQELSDPALADRIEPVVVPEMNWLKETGQR